MRKKNSVLLKLNDLGLTDFPYLPDLDDINEIDISNNPIKEINYFPSLSNLKYLKAVNCGLERLDILPPNLHYLDVSNNQIRFLPPLPPTLCILRCNYNLLTDLPPMGHLKRLSNLEAHGNPFSKDFLVFIQKKAPNYCIFETNCGYIYPIQKAFDEYQERKTRKTLCVFRHCA